MRSKTLSACVGFRISRMCAPTVKVFCLRLLASGYRGTRWFDPLRCPPHSTHRLWSSVPFGKGCRKPSLRLGPAGFYPPRLRAPLAGSFHETQSMPSLEARRSLAPCGMRFKYSIKAAIQPVPLGFARLVAGYTNDQSKINYKQEKS
jgi:hypothetical protein